MSVPGHLRPGLGAYPTIWRPLWLESEIARRGGRGAKAVHGDAQALLVAGVLDRIERRVIFPHGAIHVDFTLT